MNDEESEPKWVTKEEALYIHEKTIERHGGLSGIRDNGLLESALARPENFYAYGEQDRFALAATYAEGIARNHPFADGNKRTAYGVAGLFLNENGYDLEIRNAQKQIEFFENVASGQANREELTDFYRQNTCQIERNQDEQRTKGTNIDITSTDDPVNQSSYDQQMQAIDEKYGQDYKPYTVTDDMSTEDIEAEKARFTDQETTRQEQEQSLDIEQNQETER